MPFKCVVPGCRSNYYHVRGTPSIPMMRFPQDPQLLNQWLKAICRTDFTPTPYSHVCVRHFPSDQLIWHEYQKRADGFYQRARRRFAKLRPTAVPSIFEVDPSTHKVRSRLPVVKPKQNAKSEILNANKVPLKPENWEEKLQKSEEVKDVPIKRPRGRPRKHFNINYKKEEDEIVKSEFVSCCALGCPNTSESFIMNCLPRDNKLKQKWVEKIDRLDWSPDEDSALCEVHFETNCWFMDVGEEKILKDNAVPTLYLHGEAIKSWVTLDNSGNIENVLGNQNNGNGEQDEEQRNESEEEDPEVIVKREVLEPEIDMVEGSEDVLSPDTSSTEEQFETIYCDSTFNEDEDISNDESHCQEASSMELEESRSELENPLNLESIPQEDHQIQDRQVSCMADSESRRNAPNFLVISQPQYKKIIKRRSSSMLNDDFQCPICDRRLSRRKNLEIHMEKLHPNGELSEHHKKRKIEQITVRDPPFKKPPPPLAPLVPSCLLSTPISLPSAKPTPTLLATTMVTAPSPLDPSPAGGELKKQFLLLLPKPLDPHATPTSVPVPPINTPEQSKIPFDDTQIFSINLCHISKDKRIALKEKLRELVEAVLSKNLNPDKIIIAYDRT